MQKKDTKADILKLRSQYCYTPALTAIEKYHNVKPASQEFIEHLASRDINLSDYYLLEGVLFLRRATAEMVAEFMGYYCRRYGSRFAGKEPPLCIQRPVERDELFNSQFSDYVKAIEVRLRKFVRLKLLHSDVYAEEENGGGG